MMYEAAGKMTLLHHMLPRLKEEGHRVLIFSQMTRVLDLLEDYLSLQNWPFCRLDGSTSQYERQQLIDQFNAPNSPHFCFLLSTRAGGLGINLTSADTIFIYDLDFNPHNDLQAESRAHRIGQVRPVIVYKLITAGSVEEKIMQAAAQKMALDHLVVEKMTTGMKASEIEQFLRTGAQALFAEANVPEEPMRFDEALINNLLDRTQLVEQETRKDQLKEEEESEMQASGGSGGEKKSGFFNSFNVAQIWKEEDPAKKAEDSNTYWSDLLKGRIEAAQALKNDDLGKGRRSRKTINYSAVPDDSEKETSDSSFKKHTSSSDDDFEGGLDIERPANANQRPPFQQSQSSSSFWDPYPKPGSMAVPGQSSSSRPLPKKKLREVPVKLKELVGFIEQAEHLESSLQEALILFLNDPSAIGKLPVHLALLGCKSTFLNL